jgi:hypothetical protein
MRFQIGAMSVGDILDRGMKLLFARLPTFFFITFIVQLPMLVFQVIFPLLVEKNALAAAFGTFAGTMLLVMILSPIGTAAILYVIFQEFIDRRVGVGQAFQVAFSRFGSLFVGTLLYGLVLVAGIFMFCFPFFIFLTWFSLFSQVIVVEGRGALDSLSRSKELSEGYRMRILGVILLLGVIQGIVSGATGMVLQTVFPNVHQVQTQLGQMPQINTTNQIIQQIISFPVTALLGSFSSVCLTLLYFDLRIRKEGFDLEVAAQQHASYHVSAPLE